MMRDIPGADPNQRAAFDKDEIYRTSREIEKCSAEATYDFRVSGEDYEKSGSLNANSKGREISVGTRGCTINLPGEENVIYEGNVSEAPPIDRLHIGMHITHDMISVDSKGRRGSTLLEMRRDSDGYRPVYSRNLDRGMSAVIPLSQDKDMIRLRLPMENPIYVIEMLRTELLT